MQNPHANMPFLVTKIVRPRTPPVTRPSKNDMAGTLRNVMSETIALASQVGATIVLTLEDIYGPQVVRMRDPDYTVRMAKGAETSVVVLAIRETIHVLRIVIHNAQILHTTAAWY